MFTIGTAAQSVKPFARGAEQKTSQCAGGGGSGGKWDRVGKEKVSASAMTCIK